MTSAELAWNLYVELRKEVLSTQQLRSRAIEFKITFVGTSLGLIVAHLASVDDRLMILPAYAAIFFDLLIISYSLAIKRKGAYARLNLEPQLKLNSNWPPEYKLWEEYMQESTQRQILSFIANVGFTALAAVPAMYMLSRPPVSASDLALIVGALLGIVYVAIAHGGLAYFVNLQKHDTRAAPAQ